MKIRTDFVTNSSSSSYIAIRVTLNDGTSLEDSFDVDMNFRSSLCHLDEAEIMEIVSNHETVGELIEKVNDFYDGMVESESSVSFDNIAFSDVSELLIIDKYNIEDCYMKLMLKYEGTDQQWTMDLDDCVDCDEFYEED